MTLAFLGLSAVERKVYIDEAAARRGLAPVILQKDFWVCWQMSILFKSSSRAATVFKGGREAHFRPGGAGAPTTICRLPDECTARTAGQVPGARRAVGVTIRAHGCRAQARARGVGD